MKVKARIELVYEVDNSLYDDPPQTLDDIREPDAEYLKDVLDDNRVGIDPQVSITFEQL